MWLIAVVLVGTGTLCVGAYRLGIYSDALSVALVPVLLVMAWGLSLIFMAPRGEGVAIGVVVIEGGALYLGMLCVLLACILLGTSFFARRSSVVAAVFLCVFTPAVLALGFSLRPVRSAKVSLPAPPAQAPRDSYPEGYVWASDNGVFSDSQCVNGRPAFIEGCRAWVRQH